MIIKSRYQAAIDEFNKARQRAALEAIFARFTGQSVGLLSYEEVANKLRVTSRTSKGVSTIPVDAIVGSVGRYADFTRTFLPRQQSDAQRWATVKSAADNVGELPPIEVYQIGSAYFVIDGNHRVSIARQQALPEIDAYVTEIKTRVPFSTDDDPEALILKAEYAAFLEYTGLDRLRPEANLQVSVAGQYPHLENHIEVHRFFLEMAENRELELDEAVTRWYDEAYLPVLAAIREQEILRHFPARTETDFYLWVAAHQASVQQELGWPIRPETAVSTLVHNHAHQKSAFTRLLHSIFRQTENQTNWWESKMVDRYSRTLFGAVLVAITNNEDCHTALTSALTIAQQEKAVLYGLYVNDQPAAEETEAAFMARIQAAGVAGSLAMQTGAWVAQMLAQSLLADMMVVAADPENGRAQKDLLALVDDTSRPILLSPRAVSAPFAQILLTAGSGQIARNALFAATYFAEKWHSHLVIAWDGENPTEREALDIYLDFHDVQAAFVPLEEEGKLAVGETAVLPPDLVILSRPENARQTQSFHDKIASYLNQRIPLLVCP